MYWFKWRCHANDAGALYSHNNSEEGSEKVS